MSTRPLFLVFSIISFLTLAACAAPNHAPTWSVAPQTLGQGETLRIVLGAVDLDGDAIAVSVANAPSGLDVSQSDDGTALEIHATYALAGVQTLSLSLDDRRGGVTLVDVSVDIRPLSWRWKQTFSDPGPTTREHADFIVDAERDRAYLVGGSGYMPQGAPSLDVLWTLDLATQSFTPLAAAGDVPPAAASRRAANIPSKKVAYLYGGYLQNTELDDLYRLDYSSDPPVFTKMTQVGAPPGRALHGFAYDEISDMFITFGGFNSEDGTLSDTWTMKVSGDTATWTFRDIVGPTARYGFFYGLDSTNGLLYVWSGAQAPVDPSNLVNAASDLWAIDLRAPALAWTRILDGNEPGSPKGRRNGAFVVDPKARRLLVWGGTADGRKTVPEISFLDLRPGKLTWSTPSIADGPPVRSSCFGFFDPKRAQLVVGFGNSDSIYRDLAALGY